MNSMRRCWRTHFAISRTYCTSSNPQSPHSGKANGFEGCALYNFCAAAHVDVRIAGVVRLRRVPVHVRRTESLRVPDDAELRRCHGQVGSDSWQPELSQLRVHRVARAAAQDKGDPGERFSVPERRVCGIAARPVLVIRGARNPICVHLGERPNVEAVARPPRQGPAPAAGIAARAGGHGRGRPGAPRRRSGRLPGRAGARFPR